jgi:ribosomal protein S18 acetylase RimI-like enzyme
MSEELSRWRDMRDADLPAVSRIAGVVHPLYPEADAVFAERLRLYPAGSRVLRDDAGTLTGYVVSHPWLQDAIPALDSLLGALPMPANSYYIHDIALLPAARGQGAAQAAVASLADHAMRAGFATMAIVAIAGTQAFWVKQGFRAADTPALNAKLASYDPSARYMTRGLA